MKVLFVTNVDVRQFGTAEAILGLSTALRRQGISVLCYGSDYSAAHGPLHNGVPCYHGTLSRPRLLPRFKDVAPLVELCRRHRVDLIHCQNVYRPGWAARLVRKALGIPFVATSHSDLNPHSSPRVRRCGVRRRCRRILMDATAVTHLSTFMLENALAIAPVQDKSHLIPNGLDINCWQTPVRHGDGDHVLALGRLVPEKGFATLISALQCLSRRGHRLHLVLAGDGPERNSLQRQARDANLSVCFGLEELAAQRVNSVCFPGVVAGDRKQTLFAGARLVAFPSHPRSESFGLVVLEGMAAGKVVLASDIPSTREILPDEFGQLIPALDADRWADTIVRFWFDHELRWKVARANLARACTYSWENVAGRYRRVYESVVVSCRSRRPVATFGLPGAQLDNGANGEPTHEATAHDRGGAE